jgi:hypothetical protein
MTMFDPALDTRGCCEGLRPLTPISIANAPGLAALAYRVGTHGSFKQTLIAGLTKEPTLSRLSTRDDDDPVIALADAWATVLDVLTFYQDRLANEAYLRTATERRSVLELANSIGYDVNPGVAASTFLAFTVDDAIGAPPSATIDIGIKAQSVPRQNQHPQTFETVESIVAYRDWNALPARSLELVAPVKGQQKFYLKGTATDLKKGDAVLLVGDERLKSTLSDVWEFHQVLSIEIDPVADWTLVAFDRPIGGEPSGQVPSNAKLSALRQRAAAFGYNAPDWRAMPDNIKAAYLGQASGTPIDPTITEWPDFAIAQISGVGHVLHLDQVYPKLIAGPESWLVTETPEGVDLFTIIGAVAASRADFTISAKTTRLTLAGTGNAFERINDQVRELVVHAQSDYLAFAEQPITQPIAGDSIPLARDPGEIPNGRLMVVTGQSATDGTLVSEAVVLDRVERSQGFPVLRLTRELQHTYVPASVVVNANVVHASHGEARAEPLGSGNGLVPFQEFTLKQKPLTYISAPTSSGASSTLEVRVNDILWTEAPSLLQAGKGARVYVTRTSDEGDVTVQFGDGNTGARLPTGTNNVTARYRVGTGIAAMLDKEQINLLMSRPLGVKGVVNPLAPSGASDPETRDQARRNAPLTVLALDRIVSLQDYEDFTRAFAGVGKAQSGRLWQDEFTIVHITIGSATGGPVDETSDLFRNLKAAIDLSRDPLARLHLASFEPLQFNVSLDVLVDTPTFIAANVLAAVKNALASTFDFEHRDFAQPVSESEVIAVAQSVPGVVAIRLNALYLKGHNATLNALLEARPARFEKVSSQRVLKPAQLLTIDVSASPIAEMKRL